MENWRADRGLVFAGCKELAFCKTLASAGKGCAGPELVQWQELLSTRVRLGLPQVRRFVVAVVEHRFGSLAEICSPNPQALPAAGISYGPQGQPLALSGRVAAASMRWLARATLAMLAIAWADDCHDRNIDCSDWAEEGECDSDEMRDWMAEHCPVSCRKCPPRPRAPARAPTRGGGEL